MTAATAIALAFGLIGLLCVASIVFGLPGTWILLFFAVLVEVFDERWLGAPGQPTFGWWVIAGALVLAIAGEGLEVVSGMLGSKSAGGTPKGMWGAFFGGLAGGLLGTVILPLPLFGTLVGILLGTFLGALWGEMRSDEAKDAKAALKPALAATLARVLGTMAKTGIGSAVWVGLTVAALM